MVVWDTIEAKLEETTTSIKTTDEGNLKIKARCNVIIAKNMRIMKLNAKILDVKETLKQT